MRIFIVAGLREDGDGSGEDGGEGSDGTGEEVGGGRAEALDPGVGATYILCGCGGVYGDHCGKAIGNGI